MYALCKTLVNCLKSTLMVVLIASSFLVSNSVYATSVLQMDFNEVSQQAELVFRGTVVSKEARWNNSKTRIHTQIVLSVDEVISGNYAASTLALRFLGGELDGSMTLVGGMIYPEVGEQGIYFVESLQRKLVNPLVGWSQGHYKVVNNKVVTANGRSVISVNPRTQKLSSEGFEISEGEAKGIALDDDPNIGMDQADFIRAIKDARQ